MSEFACKNGHLMRSGEFKCRECGAKLHTMDGFTDAQWRMMESEPDEFNFREEECEHTE